MSRWGCAPWVCALLVFWVLGLSGWPGARASTGAQLNLSSATGPAGTDAQIALGLTNLAAVKGVQLDITYDPLVVAFQEAGPSGRAAMMRSAAATIAPGLVRIILYFSDFESLEVGTGEIAALTFALVGLAGSETDLTPVDYIVSTSAAEALVTTVSDGHLTVTDPTSPPILSLYPIRNPVLPRSVQLFVTSNQALEGGPSITAGSDEVSMVLVDGPSRTYAGLMRASSTIDWIVVAAQGVNGSQQGSTTLTFVF